jgi:hypothetical protein
MHVSSQVHVHVHDLMSRPQPSSFSGDSLLGGHGHRHIDRLTRGDIRRISIALCPVRILVVRLRAREICRGVARRGESCPGHAVSHHPPHRQPLRLCSSKVRDSRKVVITLPCLVNLERLTRPIPDKRRLRIAMMAPIAVIQCCLISWRAGIDLVLCERDARLRGEAAADHRIVQRIIRQIEGY